MPRRPFPLKRFRSGGALLVQMIVTDHYWNHVVDRGPWGVPLVRVHGAWRWLLDWPTVDWYHTHPTLYPE